MGVAAVAQGRSELRRFGGVRRPGSHPAGHCVFLFFFFWGVEGFTRHINPTPNPEKLGKSSCSEEFHLFQGVFGGFSRSDNAVDRCVEVLAETSWGRVVEDQWMIVSTRRFAQRRETDEVEEVE